MTALSSRRRLGLVFVGGAAGTALRAGLGLISRVGADAPGTHSGGAASAFPVTTLVINLVGAFLLGYLLERLVSLSGRMSDARAESLRLLLGTGVLGGFTTYSALAVDTVGLLAGDLFTAVIYGGGTLVGGAVAAWIGMIFGAHGGGPRPGPLPESDGLDR